ncbi:MAG: hypothetical protein AAGA08_18050 [Pseudomonadota bacterium]
MAERFKPTRRVNMALTERAWRNLKKFSADAGLEEGEAISFLFENFSSVMNEDNLTHRLRIFNAELEERKR